MELRPPSFFPLAALIEGPPHGGLTLSGGPAEIALRAATKAFVVTTRALPARR